MDEAAKASLAAARGRWTQWEEVVVSNDRGSRLVHYYLRGNGEAKELAVVGRERSPRHMSYAVQGRFLRALAAAAGAVAVAPSPSRSPLAAAGADGGAPRRWRSRREVVDWLSSLVSDQARHEPGFNRCATEHALYTWRRGKEEVIVGVYVDDLIVTGARVADIDSFKREMAARFRMNDVGALSYYLGIEVRQGKQSISLGQRAYTEKLLEHGGMAGCKPCVTPMEERLKLSKHSTAAKVDATRYRSIVGGLHYLTHTRPNITLVVGYISRFMEDPREDHWTAVKRLLRYVKGMLDQAIIFPKHGGKGGLRLTVFSEAPYPKQRKVSQSSWFSAMQT